MIDVPRDGPNGRPIRTLIVDDEPLARTRIRALLETDAEIEVVGECADGEEAVAAILDARPDLLFLDVEMPRKDGFAVLGELSGDEIPFVVFVTAYDEYAIRAFDVHAIDYLLKPYEDERFRAALSRAKTEAGHRRDSEFAGRVAEMLRAREVGPGTGSDEEPDRVDGDADGRLERLVVKRAGRVRFVDVDSIDWLEAADYYVRVHVGETSHLVRTTMKQLEADLDPTRFVRIHRSTIVRVGFIRELEPYFGGEYVVVLADGTRRSLSRSRRKRLEKALGQRL
ncbi:MAG: LytTR family DNA-binding domain-containing protein [Gemmatimonadota bacterium]|nr:LytTR family DNA-binding domain-containing protein [Gemmatimonadota bacterium]